jgi:ribosomal protein S27E
VTVNNALNEFQPIDGRGDGRDLIINCPHCGTRGAKAVVYDLIETYKRVLKHRTTWVKCSSCGKQLYSKLPADELRGRTAEQLEGIVVKRTSLIHLVLAIAAIAMCLIPVFGVVTGIVALLVNLRNRGWLRVLSIIALVISVLLTAAFF